MICKVCGYTTDHKERFCPQCGSYFIDAEAPDDSREWKGVINPDGTLSGKAESYVAKGDARPSQVPSGKTNAWSILALCFSGALLMITIVDMIADNALFVLGIPALVMSIISCRLAGNQKMKWIAILMTALSVVLFAIRIFKYA